MHIANIANIAMLLACPGPEPLVLFGGVLLVPAIVIVLLIRAALAPDSQPRNRRHGFEVVVPDGELGTSSSRDTTLSERSRLMLASGPEWGWQVILLALPWPVWAGVVVAVYVMLRVVWMCARALRARSRARSLRGFEIVLSERYW
jgi:hypothetical protein